MSFLDESARLFSPTTVQQVVTLREHRTRTELNKNGSGQLRRLVYSGELFGRRLLL